MDIRFIVKLTSKAWSLKILALMASGVPGRQAPLLAQTNASRSAFAASLKHLVDLGLLERNPGHGHPLRPEFRLTPEGKRAACIALRITNSIEGEEEFRLVRKSWSVPILALSARPRRFSQFRTGLIGITDRALSQSLGALESHDWLKRDIDTSQRMPFPTYRAVNTGRSIQEAFGGEPV